MNTLYLNKIQTDEAANILKNGGIVAIPTETVYGLAANAFNESAVKNIFKAKGRPSDNPLIVHISKINDIFKVVSEFPEKAQKLAEKFWPGPLTMILPKNENVPYCVTGGMNSVAVRFPNHEIARMIIEKSGVPLVAPSANISGRPSPTKFEHVVNDLSGKVDAVIDGGDCKVGVESTVLSLLNETPIILRPGLITNEEISKVIGKVEISPLVLKAPEKGEKIISPGMKYKHYSPETEVVMISGSSENYSQYVNSKDSENSGALCFEEDIPFLKVPYISYGKRNCPEEQAKNLFDSLRKSDKLNVDTVYAHFESENEVSAAICNRLIRAAGFKWIKV